MATGMGMDRARFIEFDSVEREWVCPFFFCVVQAIPAAMKTVRHLSGIDNKS